MHATDNNNEHPVIANFIDFDNRSGSFIENLIFNNRLLVILLCACMTLFMAYQSSHLKLSASFEKMIPTSHPYIENYLANKSDLAGVANVVRIVIESKNGTILDSNYLDILKNINDEVFLLPGVERAYMKSLWTPATRWTAVTEVGLDGGPVIDASYDGSAAELEKLRVNIERSGEIGQLVAADFRSSVIYVPLLEGHSADGSTIDYASLSDSLEDIRSRYQSDDIQIYIVGFAKIVGDLIDGLRQVVGFFLLAIFICTIVLYWYTRCIKSTLLVVVCSLAAVVWLLGILPTLGYDLDPYSILVPFLVFAIGMSHGAQKMNGIMQDIGRGTHRLIAARYTFRRLFLAGMTALLADVVGFAVLMVIDIDVIQDLAVTASIGVAVLIFTNLVLLPILLSFTGVNLQAAKRSLSAELRSLDVGDQNKHPFWVFLDGFTSRKGATIGLIIASLIGVIGFVISLNIQVGDLDPGAPELRVDSRYNLDNKFVTEHYAASSDVFIIMLRTQEFGCALYETVKLADDLEWALSKLLGVESTSSLAGLSKRAAVGLNEGSMKWYEIPKSQGMLNAIVTRAPRQLFNQNCDLLTVYAYLKDHKAATLESVVNSVKQFASESDNSRVKILLAAGNSGIEAATNLVVKKANSQMLFLVYAAVILLAFITFRTWKGVICAILPLILTSVLCEALMVWLGIGIKVATLPVIALGVGIGVDYSLYILSVTLVNLRIGLSLSESYYRALIFTGRVVVLTGITLGIAVLTWYFSPIKFQADMGILLGFMFIWNMLGALIVLPSLAHFLLKPKVILAHKGI